MSLTAPAPLLDRIRNASQLPQDADFIVAIEGGVEWSFLSDSKEPSLMCFAWAVVLRSDNRLEGTARTAAFLLPPPIADLISGERSFGGRLDVGLGGGWWVFMEGSSAR